MQGPWVNTGEAGSNSTSLTLLEKVRRKETDAWERLMSLYTPLVLHWCRLARLQYADAEEVKQAVFAAVWQGFPTFSRDHENPTFRGWLRVITRNAIVDHIPATGTVGAGGSSAQELLTAFPATSETDEMDEESLSREKYVLYRRAIELMELSFEPMTLKAFWMGLAGRTGKEIATELGISPNAAFTAKSRVLKRLRDEFGDVLDLGHDKPNLPPET